jgi:hypothetical protein
MTKHLLPQVAITMTLAFILAWGAETLHGPYAGGDSIAFYAAAALLWDGQSPYDPAAEAAVQQPMKREAGWAPGEPGDCLPYFYPPWLAQACTPLLPLGFPRARLVWLFLTAWSLVGAAVLLGGLIPGLSPRVTAAAVVAFAPALLAVAMGQVAPLVLFSVALGWRLLRGGRDRGSGRA